MPKLIDANVILRYLLNDNMDMAAEAKRVIESGAYTTGEILAEVVYVLKGVYKVDRLDIATCLTTMLTEIDIQHPEVYRKALTIFTNKNLDFVDCVLIARHQILGDEVFSFDRKLNHNLEE